MAVDIAALAGQLNATLDPNQSRQGKTCTPTNPSWTNKLTHSTAEAALRTEEAKPGFSLALLQIVTADSYPLPTRQASALFFKNFVRRNWVDENGNHNLPQDVLFQDLWYRALYELYRHKLPCLSILRQVCEPSATCRSASRSPPVFPTPNVLPEKGQAGGRSRQHGRRLHLGRACA